MPNHDLDDILASLRSAPDGVESFKSIVKNCGGLWFEPVTPRDLFKVYLMGLTGSGPTATIALVHWMRKAHRLRNAQTRRMRL